MGISDPKRTGWGGHIRGCEPITFARPAKKCGQNGHARRTGCVLPPLISFVSNCARFLIMEKDIKKQLIFLESHLLAPSILNCKCMFESFWNW